MQQDTLTNSRPTIKLGTSEHEKRNTGGTAELPGTAAEQPNITRNTSVTPQNNGTLQNEKQLHCS